VLQSPENLAQSAAETSAERHARLLAEKIALNVIADEIVLRGGSEAVSNSVNWQNGHRAILDDSICRKRA
jgi:hypothetical protein